MPGYDTTGPGGSGPLTGKGLGRCKAGYKSELKQSGSIEEQSNENCEPLMRQDQLQDGRVYGRGRGGIPCGCGRGSGFRRGRNFQN